MIALLGVVLFFAYQAWQNDYGDGAQTMEATVQQPASATSELPAPRAAQTASGEPAGQAPKAGPAAATQVSGASGTANTADVVRVQTDTLDVSIPLQGGGFNKVVLERYPYSKDQPKRKLALLTNQNRSPKQPFFIFQTGLAGTHEALTGAATRYSAPKREYRLASGQKTLNVPLTYVNAEQGYTVRINYRFERGGYVVHLSRKVTNNSGSALQVAPYARWIRNTVQAGKPQKFMHTFFGMGVYQQDGGEYKFKKHGLDDFDDTPYNQHQTGGWLAMLQQYFVAAVIPPSGETVTFSGKPASHKGRYYTQMLGATATIPSGASHSFSTRLYIGPKLHGKLDSIAPGLSLTENYGIFTTITTPLYWVLSKLHALTGNWGWAIVLLTLLIRALFFPLSERQYRSMAKMRKFGPRMKELRERYSGDREQLNKAMMELYRKEKFNPLSGCWPVLLQFPVFIALYYLLIYSVELRQATFILWLQDLSAPDPYYILPIIYGITMWFQQRLSGQTATMEPTQQKMMNIMPIGLAAFFSLFPSGLVLYYVVSNGFTIIQQWVITRKLDREGLSHKHK